MTFLSSASVVTVGGNLDQNCTFFARYSGKKRWIFLWFRSWHTSRNEIFYSEFTHHFLTLSDRCLKGSFMSSCHHVCWSLYSESEGWSDLMWLGALTDPCSKSRQRWFGIPFWEMNEIFCLAPDEMIHALPWKWKVIFRLNLLLWLLLQKQSTRVFDGLQKEKFYNINTEGVFCHQLYLLNTVSPVKSSTIGQLADRHYSVWFFRRSLEGVNSESSWKINCSLICSK